MKTFKTKKVYSKSRKYISRKVINKWVKKMLKMRIYAQ